MIGIVAGGGRNDKLTFNSATFSTKALLLEFLFSEVTDSCSTAGLILEINPVKFPNATLSHAPLTAPHLIMILLSEMLHA